MNKIIDNIVNQIKNLKLERKEPKFVILDIETWNMLRSSKDAREYIWYGHYQEDPYASDKIMGIPVAVVTGNASRIVEVV